MIAGFVSYVTSLELTLDLSRTEGTSNSFPSIVVMIRNAEGLRVPAGWRLENFNSAVREITIPESLDASHQAAVMVLMAGAFGPFPGTVRAIGEAKKEDPLWRTR